MSYKILFWMYFVLKRVSYKLTVGLVRFRSQAKRALIWSQLSYLFTAFLSLFFGTILYTTRQLRCRVTNPGGRGPIIPLGPNPCWGTGAGTWTFKNLLDGIFFLGFLGDHLLVMWQCQLAVLWNTTSYGGPWGGDFKNLKYPWAPGGGDIL